MSGWVVLAASLLALKVYLRLTMGWCRSKARLAGKTAIVTGGNSGIGALTARDLAMRGAHVILACRNIKKAERVREEIISATGNANVEVRPLDLSSFASVCEFAGSILATERALHILVNNAGMPGSGGKCSKDGVELAMQINHLGHFLLTVLLLDLLRRSAPARVVFVSSLAHRFSRLNPEKLLTKKRPGIAMDFYAYSDSKLCNIVTAVQLDKLLKGSGVTANSVHPGVVLTDIWYKTPRWVQVGCKVLFGFMKTVEEGAQPVIHAAVSEEVANVSGKYFVDCKETKPSAKARDENFAWRVWNSSCRAVGLPSLPEQNQSLSPYLDYIDKFRQQSSLSRL